MWFGRCWVEAENGRLGVAEGIIICCCCCCVILVVVVVVLSVGVVFMRGECTDSESYCRICGDRVLVVLVIVVCLRGSLIVYTERQRERERRRGFEHSLPSHIPFGQDSTQQGLTSQAPTSPYPIGHINAKPIQRAGPQNTTLPIPVLLRLFEALTLLQPHIAAMGKCVYSSINIISNTAHHITPSVMSRERRERRGD